MVIPNILWVTCISIAISLELDFIDIRMLILTRVFCVLLYARVRLSGSVSETHLLSWSFAWRSNYLSSFQLISVMCSDLVFDYCIWDFYCILFIYVIYIVASWTTIFLYSTAYCYITLCLWSMIILFTVYAKFSQI